MLNKVPVLIIILVIAFLITSLLSFIAMENIVALEKNGDKSDNSNAQIGMDKQPKTANAVVVIDIVKPNQ